MSISKDIGLHNSELNSFMRPWLRVPKVQLLFVLLVIFGVALLVHAPRRGVFIIAATLGFCVFFDLFFTFIKKGKLFIPFSGMVTALIVALLADPNAFWYQVALVSAIAMGTKNFLRISGRHVFNPAAIGLFAGGILFHQYVTWWGVSFPSIREMSILNLALFLLVVLPVAISGYRLRRFPSILSFLIVSILLSLIQTLSFSLAPLGGKLTDSVTVFFATVMLPEPMTSPATKKRQVIFGVAVAAIAAVLSHPQVSAVLSTNGLLPDVFIPALLIGNILFSKFK